MEKTPAGSSVGVDDPYEFVERCDHLTDDGRCRFAFERPEADPRFAEARQRDDYACPVAEGCWEWRDCPHMRRRGRARECARCGLEEVRMAHDRARPLLEEHHLSYRDESHLSHEITVTLCRWCHAKVHASWARVDDDAAPDPEALAAREERRGRELAEFAFSTAGERVEPTDDSRLDGGGHEGRGDRNERDDHGGCDDHGGRDDPEA
ncbi:DUF7097 family protein [Halomarina pelagica]|uniref:DUF7097 family protein n=1 Tax=Halomarina pelagica TaxID=2961599 RepID=UPI0020C1D2AC|nr:hypothetical protein [Halomarina sp. BND7]